MIGPSAPTFNTTFTIMTAGSSTAVPFTKMRGKPGVAGRHLALVEAITFVFCSGLLFAFHAKRALVRTLLFGVFLAMLGTTSCGGGSSGLSGSGTTPGTYYVTVTANLSGVTVTWTVNLMINDY
jgi:hypothetical protein